MALQDAPICFHCGDAVEAMPVYEAPCGHEGCPSAVFHGLCLMEYREHGQANMRKFARYVHELMRRAEALGVVWEDEDG